MNSNDDDALGALEMRMRAIVAENIRAARARRALSQDEMAELAGVHRNYLGSIEREQRNISIESLCKLALALGCEPFELLQTDFTPRRQ
ncbi:helix-turn-helix domain-containing protein [Paraburkholderia tropica]|uniref:helix-turn-helix domain-containing protein n=1 Tax=Paraburkholderia tropica TaxID=92647 RepID=UPI002ABE1A27|nr:helix-turn-helix transcriptional regulator [Paraburkholderia tropica]